MVFQRWFYKNQNSLVVTVLWGNLLPKSGDSTFLQEWSHKACLSWTFRHLFFSPFLTYFFISSRYLFRIGGVWGSQPVADLSIRWQTGCALEWAARVKKLFKKVIQESYSRKLLKKVTQESYSRKLLKKVIQESYSRRSKDLLPWGWRPLWPRCRSPRLTRMGCWDVKWILRQKIKT